MEKLMMMKVSCVGDYIVDGDESSGDSCNDASDDNSKNVIVIWPWSNYQ